MTARTPSAEATANGHAPSRPLGDSPLGDGKPSSLAALIELPEELVERVAERVAERLADRAPAADGWLRGAGRIAAYIDAPRSRVYALASARRIPVERDGSSLIARKSDLDAWVRSGGGKRP